jgi:peptidoglycan/LPS O-acetylase OafA/YrhL
MSKTAYQTTARSGDNRPPSGTEGDKGFRLDIQGIRAIAIGLVLLAHAGVPGFAGGFIGIDVFFVLSGFLITGLVVREIEKTGRVSLKKFYARRARRLLPMAALVLVFIGICAIAIYPIKDQVETGRQIVGAALYFVNWIYAAEQVDYFNAGSQFLSPVQHYWSLSVEEQFYLAWPAMMLIASAVALRTRRSVKPVLLIGLVPLSLASLAYSIHLTASNPDTAYFSTLTRIWELGFGAILAIVLPRSLNLRPVLANGLVALGILVILGSALTFGEGSPFPGWIGLFPVLATIAILVGGSAVSRGWAVSLLCLRPVQYLGEISYAWYLWHWPFVVFALALWPDLGWGWLVAATLVSLAPTVISHVLVENPIRHSKRLRVLPGRTLAIGAVCSVAAAAVGIGLAVDRLNATVVPGDQVAGAAIVREAGVIPPQERATRIAPDPFVASEDRAVLYDDGCFSWQERVKQPPCVYGNPDSSKTVVLFGDSRAMSYFPAIEQVAQDFDWRLVGLVRGECTPAQAYLDENCELWRNEMLERITQEEDPDLVILGTATKGTYRVTVDGERLTRKESQPYLVEGMVRTIRDFKAAGAKVLVIRDQTVAPFKPPDCVAEHIDDLDRCVYRPAARGPRAFELEAARITDTRTIDPMQVFCRDDGCPAVIGDAIVNLDRYHVSATFALTMAPWFERQLPRLRG